MSKASLAKIIEANLPKPLLNLTPEQVSRLKDMSAITLGVIASLGITTVALVAPNALKLLKLLPNQKYTKGYLHQTKRSKKKISRVIYYLRQHNYIQLLPKGDDFLVKITQKGRKKLKLLNLQSLSLPKNNQWKKTWWFILADIPIEFRSQINSFRKKIKSIGAYSFQKSIWVYPFDPRDELAFLSKYYGLDPYITFLEATNLDPEDEHRLKHHFKSII